VIKSTVPVGTADEVSVLPAVTAAGIEIVSNPEFLRQGSAVQDFLHPDRVVIGAESHQSAVDVARLYAALDAPIVAVTRRSAELAKYTANAFLATRISFINEVAHVASVVNADIDDVARIVGMDRRIGSAFLKAGLGWGGSCFPKDVQALAAMARSNGCHTPIIDATFETNNRQSEYAARAVLRAVRNGTKPLVAVLGLAFKPDTDDVRGSPALRVAQRLAQEGVTLRAHDPLAAANARRVMPELDYFEDPYIALEGVDAVLLATDWKEYLALDWALVRELMRGNTVFDGRNFLDGPGLQQLGFHYLSFGRPSLNGHEPITRKGPGGSEGFGP
jgi:UDPglucose 6-dehydrogenase